MSMRKKILAAAQALVAAGMVAALVAACGGGGGGGASTGVVQTYTSTAGVGEVLQFGINTTNMTYTYTVNYTAYAASGVVAGKTGSGPLLSMNAGGSYNVGASSDGFITGGKLLPLQNGLLVGHVQVGMFGTAKIPVFGVSNPITTVAGLAGTYNYQGFSCSSLGIANVLGNGACLSHSGTVSVAASGVYTVCKGGDVTTSPGTNACAAQATGTISALATPGVFDYRNAANGHAGWFFAFTAPNGQKIAVIDHDDSTLLEYGHTVLATYISTVSGAADGKYFVKNNEGGESLLAVSGVSLTDASLLGTYSGTLTLNSPWAGLEAYNFAVSGVSVASGVAMAAGTGVYTYTSTADPAVFGVGIRYSP